MISSVTFGLAALAAAVGFSCVDAATYMYDGKTGPDVWATMFPNDCGGKKQSPINIRLSEALPAPTGAFTIWGGQTPFDALAKTAHGTLKENFASRNIHLNSSLSPFSYYLWDVHWHTPSEHTINGIRYPIERHMVFYPIDRDELRSHYKRYRYIVIGTLFGEGGATEDIFLPEAEYQTIGYAATNNVNAPALSKPFTAQPKDITSDIKNTYWTYEGSLTTPNCTEVVDWHVSQVVRQITPDVLESVKAFQLKMATPGTPTSMLNARPVQPLNGRVVNSVTYSVSVVYPNNGGVNPLIGALVADNSSTMTLMTVMIVFLFFVVVALGCVVHSMRSNLKKDAAISSYTTSDSSGGRAVDMSTVPTGVVITPAPTSSAPSSSLPTTTATSTTGATAPTSQA